MLVVGLEISRQSYGKRQTWRALRHFTQPQDLYWSDEQTLV